MIYNYSINKKNLVDVDSLIFCKTTPLLLRYKLRGFLSHRHNPVETLDTSAMTRERRDEASPFRARTSLLSVLITKASSSVTNYLGTSF